MADSIRTTYLDHSGFVIETAQHILLFDYYRDPAQVLKTGFNPAKKLYIFSSHAHSDHFNTAINTWQQQAAAYILSIDIKAAGGLVNVSESKTHYLAPYTTLNFNDLSVAAYGSTDEGISFVVETDGWRIFHAGDLNWWHWKEDTPANIEQAKEAFFRELGHLKGLQFDIAFFPVDSRLEEYRDIGVKELVKVTEIDHLVAMHACGLPWTPPANFTGYRKTLWCPDKPGQTRLTEK